MPKRVIIALTAICLLAFGLRLIPYETVFGMGFVNYIETDAWYKMLIVQQINDMTFWDGLRYAIDNIHLFAWLVAIIPGDIEVTGAWLPPILGTLTIIIVFMIGRELFNNTVGLLSALFASIIPSEFLNRSLLGFTDHHVTEVLLLCMVVLFTIKSIKHNRKLWIILGGISLWLYMINWLAGVYLAGLLIATILVGMVILNVIQKRKFWHGLSGVVSIACIGLILYLPLNGYQQLVFLIPSQDIGLPAQTTVEIIRTVFMPVEQRTISELMPLLMPFGDIDGRVLITNLHFFTFTLLAGFIILVKTWKRRDIFVILVWTIILLVITMNERRFLYYFTVPVALLSGIAVYELACRIKGSRIYNIITLSAPLVVVSVIFIILIGAQQPIAMTREWHNALTYLKAKPQGVVTAWTDYGHWILYVSNKTPNYLPGPGGETLANFYLSTDKNEAKQYLDKLETDYLIVDEKTIVSYMRVLEKYAGVEPESKQQTMIYRLYYDDWIPDYLRQIYEVPGIKIFEFVK